MKNKPIMLYLMLIISGLQACKKEDSPSPSDNYMHCKLNGTLWQSVTSNVGGIYNSSSGLIVLGGDDETILINGNLSGITGVGNYPVGVGTSSAISVTNGSVAWYINVDFGTGIFYLDEIKNPVSGNYDIKGRFEGTATNAANDTIHITEGEIETF